MLNPQQFPQVQYDLIKFVGGLDQITSAYTVAPGVLRDCLNYSCMPNGGYYRIAGYERFDGRPSPSDATIFAVAISILPGKSILVGDTGTFGNVSGTVAVIDPFGKFVVLTKTATTFSYAAFVPGPIVINGVTKGEATAVYSDLSLKEIAQFGAAAANIYRADIGPVPGSGPIRGVAYYKDAAYAWRDNAAGTACEIYRSSPGGWQQVVLGRTVAFSEMSKVPSDEGIVLTQGAVTAKIDRWVITGGDVTAGDAVGYFVVSNLQGGEFTSGTATYDATSVKLGGASAQITLLPGGTYNFSIGNFTAHYDTERLYGADGVNHAFEFDGSVLVPIIISASHKPKYAVVHANHLFLAIASSLIHSALGNPYNFEVLAGAGEIGTGGMITGLLIMPGSDRTATLLVTSRNATWMLYGYSSADWKFVNYNVGVGALDRTLQNLFDAFSADDSGVSMLRQTLNFGNFEAARITHNIQRFIRDVRGHLACSSVSRGLSQYRLYYDNGFGVYSTVTPQGVVGHGIVFYPHPVVCTFDGEKSDATTMNLFGTSNGYVMHNDRGSSFDGEKLLSYFTTNINSVDTPRMRKRFRKAVLEVMGDAYYETQVGYIFEWASVKVEPHSFNAAAGALSQMPYWDNMIWDAFYWDGKSNDAVELELNGTGENIQLVLLSELDYVLPYIIQSAVLHYTPRRGNR